MPSDFLAGEENKELKDRGESEIAASTRQGKPHGFEVNYRTFTINGRMLGHGEPIRVKSGERVLFHVLNGSATEIRSLALPGHTFLSGCDGWESGTETGPRAGAMAGHRGTDFGGGGNEPSGGLDPGRYGR